MVTMDEVEFASFMGQLLQGYSRLGVATFDYRIDKVQPLNPSVTLITLCWMLDDREGNRLVAFRTRYLVGAAAAGKKILGVIVVDERQQMAALGPG